ncbi:hypothetical protein [Nocardia vulneris]|uniref:Dialkylrecorsinol condensing enzyme n=1 Tax=Nocardia vulneris TaxID=1141657 RepID=A0ABR4ZA33_9NOCA|nr:hypothetical protein [Nocardia vulneris]KIA62172.1 hypothetical protein FG87_26640 [Nocardia vulneris]
MTDEPTPMARTDAPTATVLWYSQTGQAREAAEALLAPLHTAGMKLEWVQIRPATEYPFPWTLPQFAGIFPEAVDPRGHIPVRTTAPVTADLVVIAFPVWYLAPAIPIRSLLITTADIVAGRDVIGLAVCRNVWCAAAVELAQLVTAAGGRYLGTISAIDTHSPLITAITTVHWLLTGRREAFGRFPRAGVTDAELTRLTGLGERLAHDGSAITDNPAAAPITPALAAMELVMAPLFRVFGRIAAASPPGSLARRAKLTGTAGIIIAALVGGPPIAALTRLVARHRFDNWLDRRLAPAVHPQGSADRQPSPRRSSRQEFP